MKSRQNESLFHYTDIAAVASILKNQKLWLTNVGFLNDSQEFYDGLTVLTAHVKRELPRAAPELQSLLGTLKSVMQAFAVIADSANLFTCSFSRAPNLLSQWRAYGNFAIEFSRSELEVDDGLYECVYNTKDKKKACDSLVEYFCASYPQTDGESDSQVVVLESILTRMMSFKNFHFEAEQEVRMITRSKVGNSGVLYRARGDYLVPYMEKVIPLKSVKAIHVGPVADQKLASKSLRSFLASIGKSDLPIVCSDIPFRA